LVKREEKYFWYKEGKMLLVFLIKEGKMFLTLFDKERRKKTRDRSQHNYYYIYYVLTCIRFT